MGDRHIELLPIINLIAVGGQNAPQWHLSGQVLVGTLAAQRHAAVLPVVESRRGDARQGPAESVYRPLGGPVRVVRDKKNGEKLIGHDSYGMLLV